METLSQHPCRALSDPKCRLLFDLGRGFSLPAVGFPLSWGMSWPPSICRRRKQRLHARARPLGPPQLSGAGRVSGPLGRGISTT